MREFAPASERHPEHRRARTRVRTGGHGYPTPGQSRAEPGTAGVAGGSIELDYEFIVTKFIVLRPESRHKTQFDVNKSGSKVEFVTLRY